MKRLTLALTICALAICATYAQVQIKSSGTARKSVVERQKSSLPGGATPGDFKIIDDGLYRCLYDYTVNTDNKAGERVEEEYYCVLDMGKNAARFTDLTVFRADSAALAPKPDKELHDRIASELGRQKYRFYGDVIQGFPSGELTYTDLVTPQYLEYSEPLGSMVWEICEETDTVCGYLCVKATTNYGGREWTAWFAEEIPLPFGPWKFNGLPGLIMRATDSEGVHDFKAIAFTKSDIPVAKPNNSLIAKTTREKFIENKARFEKSPYRYNPPEAIQNMDVYPTGEILINGVEIPKRPNGYTPVELQ